MHCTALSGLERAAREPVTSQAHPESIFLLWLQDGEQMSYTEAQVHRSGVTAIDVHPAQFRLLSSSAGDLAVHDLTRLASTSTSGEGAELPGRLRTGGCAGFWAVKWASYNEAVTARCGSPRVTARLRYHPAFLPLDNANHLLLCVPSQRRQSPPPLCASSPLLLSISIITTFISSSTSSVHAHAAPPRVPVTWCSHCLPLTSDLSLPACSQRCWGSAAVGRAVWSFRTQGVPVIVGRGCPVCTRHQRVPPTPLPLWLDRWHRCCHLSASL